MANASTKTPATEATIYRIGRLSQVVTSALAVKLAQDQNYDLDAPIISDIPTLTMHAPSNQIALITPRLLMANRAGLPSEILGGHRQHNPAPYTDMLSLLKFERLVAPPNTRTQLSMIGFDLLGYAMQAKHNVPFATLAKQSLFTPAGMTTADYRPFTASQTPAYDINGKPVTAYNTRDLPADGLQASALDMAKLMQALTNSQQFNAAAQQQYRQLAHLPDINNIEFKMGLGWFSQTHFGHGANSGPLLFRAGIDDYHRGSIVFLPKLQLGVILLTNGQAGANKLPALAWQTLRILFETKTGKKWLPNKHRSLPENTSTDIADLVGTFDTELGVVFSRRDGDSLAITLNDQDFQLTPQLTPLTKKAGAYRLEKRLFDFLGWRLTNVKLAITHNFGKAILTAHDGVSWYPFGVKLKPVKLSSRWQQRIGDYALIDAKGEIEDWSRQGGFVRLRFKQGYLLAEKRTGTPNDNTIEEVLALRPIDGTTAIIEGIGYNRGGSVRVTRIDGTETIQYSGLQLQRMP